MDNITITKMQQCDIADSIKLEKDRNIHILNESILSEDITKDNYIYLVAKENGKVIGYIGISYILDTADIISIVVSKDYAKKGIATLLLDKIFSECILLNISKIMLEVRKSNLPAQNLYVKNGFKQISIRKNYYDNTEDAYIYEKELPTKN